MSLCVVMQREFLCHIIPFTLKKILIHYGVKEVLSVDKIMSVRKVELMKCYWFVDWLDNLFIIETANLPHPLLLIMDNLPSHISIKAIELA